MEVLPIVDLPPRIKQTLIFLLRIESLNATFCGSGIPARTKKKMTTDRSNVVVINKIVEKRLVILFWICLKGRIIEKHINKRK